MPRAILAGAMLAALAAPSPAQAEGSWIPGSRLLDRMRGAMSDAVSETRASIEEKAQRRQAEQQAVRDLMGVSLEAAVAELAGPQGFAGEARLALPEPLASHQTRLAAFGQSGPLDEFQTLLNEAALVSLAAAAEPLRADVAVVDLVDARGLLVGGEHAAVQHLWLRRSPEVDASARAAAVEALTRSQAWARLAALDGRWRVDSARDSLRDAIAEDVAQRTLAALAERMRRHEALMRADPQSHTAALRLALSPNL